MPSATALRDHVAVLLAVVRVAVLVVIGGVVGVVIIVKGLEALGRNGCSHWSS
jgi:hypothetical protein